MARRSYARDSESRDRYVSLFLVFGHFFHGLPEEMDAYMSVTNAMSPDRKLDWVLPRVAVDPLDAELLAMLGVPKAEYLEWLGNYAQARQKRLAPFLDYHLTTLQQLNAQIDGGLSWQRILLPLMRSLKGIRILTPFFDSGMIALALSLPVSLKYQNG